MFFRSCKLTKRRKKRLSRPRCAARCHAAAERSQRRRVETVIRVTQRSVRPPLFSARHLMQRPCSQSFYIVCPSCALTQIKRKTKFCVFLQFFWTRCLSVGVFELRALTMRRQTNLGSLFPPNQNTHVSKETAPPPLPPKS